MARSSCFSIDDGMERYTLREIASPDSSRYRTVVRNMCCRCRVFTFSIQACSRSCHVFLWLRGADFHRFRTRHYNRTSHDLHFSLRHPSSCRVGKCQSEAFLCESSRFSYIGKLYRAAFSWFTKCEFRSCQDVVSWTILRRVFIRRVFFKHSVNRLFLPSLVGAKIVGWELDPGSGSCVEMDSEVSLCSVFMFVL